MHFAFDVYIVLMPDAEDSLLQHPLHPNVGKAGENRKGPGLCVNLTLADPSIKCSQSSQCHFCSYNLYYSLVFPVFARVCLLVT